MKELSGKREEDQRRLTIGEGGRSFVFLTMIIYVKCKEQIHFLNRD